MVVRKQARKKGDEDVHFVFMALALFFLTLGVIDLRDFINNPDTYMR